MVSICFDRNVGLLVSYSFLIHRSRRGTTFAIFQLLVPHATFSLDYGRHYIARHFVSLVRSPCISNALFCVGSTCPSLNLIRGRVLVNHVFVYSVMCVSKRGRIIRFFQYRITFLAKYLSLLA